MKLGLVLAGGGGRGAYQIGIFEALKELGIDKMISGVTGTSIGALNAILFLQGDIEAAKAAWRSISIDKVLPTTNIDLVARGILLALGCKQINFVKKHIPKILEKGNISRQGLIDVMDRYVDFNKVLSSLKTCYVTCSELPSLNTKYFKIKDHTEEDVRNILLATSALPIIYECEKIEVSKYLDGGIVDNIPIQPLYGEGYDTLIVVHLSKNSRIDRGQYPNTNIIELIPNNMESTINSTLDFSIESTERRMKQGYNDCINMFKPIIEITKYQLQRVPAEFVSSIGKGILDSSYRIKKLLDKKKTL